METRSVRKNAREAARAFARAGIVVLLLVAWGVAYAGEDDGAARRARPLAFEANRGQADESVKFLARGAGFNVFLTPTEAVLTLGDGRAVMRVRPVGASSEPKIVGDAELPGLVHYARTASGGQPVSAPTYARVRYTDLYPGVDLVYYGRPRHLEYDFIVQPDADPGAIALSFDGAERVEVDAGGDLVLRTAAGELRQPRPVVYQETDGHRSPVTASYVLDDEGRVRMKVGAYDRSRPLVIDPVLAYSTYLGGSNEESDWLWGGVVGIAVDAAGNAYLAGTTTSVDFPTTPGAVRTLNGEQDAFVTKLSPTGAVLYSTYLGGPCADIARSIAVDAAGNAYITGRAHGGVCFAEVNSGALVAKLSPTGTLLYGYVFGGSLADISMGQAIAVDAQGHAYVAGFTQSNDFPTTPGAFRTERCVGPYGVSTSEGFVAKINPEGSGLIYSTFLCGNGDDSPNGIAIDAAGNAYIAGSTNSHDFPTVNPIQDAHRGGPVTETGFLSKLSADGSHLIYSTYLGGTYNDAIQGIAIDGQGNVYIAGWTQSDDFPTTPGVIQPEAGNRFCLDVLCTDAFVAKINATGTALVYSTYLFGEGHDSASKIAVDAGGNAYVIGSTASIYFPILDAFQTRPRGPEDAFVTKLSPDGSRLLYSSYLGGSHTVWSPLNGTDNGSSIAVDQVGNAYVAGYTWSYDFPTTPGAFQPGLGGGGASCDYYGTPCGDVFVAKITAGGPGIVPPISLTVNQGDVAPGGSFTATWAGAPLPSANDFLLLHKLGAMTDDYVAYWPTGGTAGGTLLLTLPPGLTSGTYELRLLSADPNFSNLPEEIARSRPIRIGTVAATADLTVTGIAMTPAQPIAGQPVAVTVTVKNQGAVAASQFAVDLYKNQAVAPGPGAPGDVRCTITTLGPGASTQCAGTVTYTAGSFKAWAQVDTGGVVTEADETNNVFGPKAIVVAAIQADLVVTAVGNPPVSALPGAAFAASDTVKNQGNGPAVASATRYYLSLDGAKDGAARLLTGVRAVPALVAGTQSAGAVMVTVPATTPFGTYRLLACADDTGAVAESNEVNNCLASAGAVRIGRPDLVETAVTNPPPAARPGTTLTVTDTVRNQGATTSGVSATRYYLSVDGQKGAGDILLAGWRSVAALAPDAVSTQTVTLVIPVTAPLSTYRLLACADDTNLVVESDEANNCLASAGTVAVTQPDLVQQSVSGPAVPVKRGVAFTVSDTVVNDSPVATPRTAATRYYLSADGVKGPGDALLVGYRVVPVMAAHAASSGSAPVAIPWTVQPGTYVLLACADDTSLVAESSKANNCRASATALIVAP
jgi:subtilase family serine protease